MRTYTAPIFNLLSNLWFCDGNITPSQGSADAANIPCQKYYSPHLSEFNQRKPFDNFYNNFVPWATLRFPRDPIFLDVWYNWKVVVTEVPAGSGQYYRTGFCEVMHEGFPNEYAILLACQCNDDGFMIPPPGGSVPFGTGSNGCGD